MPLRLEEENGSCSALNNEFCTFLFPFLSGTHLVRLQGLALHVEVPDFGGQVVSGEQVAAAVAELNVRHRGDDFREEGASAGVFRLLKHW